MPPKNMSAATKAKVAEDAAKIELTKSYKELDYAREKVAAFRRQHANVLEELDDLNGAVEQRQDRVKKLAHAFFKGYPRGEFKAFEGRNVAVFVAPKFKRNIDEAALIRDWGDLLRSLDVVVHVPEHDEINKSRLDALIYSKTITADLVEKYITRTEPDTPSVSFKQPTPTDPDKEKK